MKGQSSFALFTALAFMLAGGVSVTQPDMIQNSITEVTTEYPNLVGEPVDTVQDSAMQTEGVEYDDVVKIYKNGELKVKTHNALMEGEAIVRNQSLSSTTNYDWTEIALGGGAAPTDQSGELDQQFTSTVGLEPQEATVEPIGSGTDDIEWNLTHTFTASGSATVNTTAVMSTSAPSDIDYYAGASFGRNLNVLDGDKITVEWNFDID